MIADDDVADTGDEAVSDRPRLAVVSRGDPLTPYLHAALRRRYDVVADIGVELGGVRRMLVAGLTFRPRREDWNETYMKSNVGLQLRSRLAVHGLAAVPGGFDVAIQTHALFATRSPRTMVYVDCTYREAMTGWPAWTPHTGAARERWLRTETEIFQQALHLFTFTDRSQTSLIEDYGIAADKITVVGEGINFEARPAPRADTGRSPDRRPTVLFVGKDFDRKGGPDLLEAFAQVRARIPDVRLVVVGTSLPGPVPDGIELSGLVTSRAQMAELYAAADVFCLPSRFDPAPLVVLEAMAYGLPCVLSTSASHHVRDLVETGRAGRLAPDGDPAALAEGIITYLEDPALARTVGAVGQRAVLENYRWDDVVDRMAPAIDAAVRPGSRG